MSLITQKQLITRILLQDLKHNQLIKALRDLGFDDSGVYSLDLLSIVAGIQEIPEEGLSEQWVAIYQRLMDKATSLPVSALGTELRELAEEGYELLVACRRVEAAS